MTRILLAEDNEMIRDMLSFRLERRGFEMLVADDGQTAIEVAMSQQPDLILMDMNLPVIDGWTATRTLKNDPATGRVPVIALSADDTEPDRLRALAAGCDDYDTKPVTLDRLLRKIAEQLTKATQNQVATDVNLNS